MNIWLSTTFLVMSALTITNCRPQSEVQNDESTTNFVNVSGISYDKITVKSFSGCFELVMPKIQKEGYQTSEMVDYLSPNNCDFVAESNSSADSVITQWSAWMAWEDLVRKQPSTSRPAHLKQGCLRSFVKLDKPLSFRYTYTARHTASSTPEAASDLFVTPVSPAQVYNANGRRISINPDEFKVTISTDSKAFNSRLEVSPANSQKIRIHMSRNGMPSSYANADVIFGYNGVEVAVLKYFGHVVRNTGIYSCPVN